MKKVIIIGASSGIGADLAKVYSKNGWTVGLTARRLEKLQELQKQLPTPAFVKQMDVAQANLARQHLEELVYEMEGMDLIIINAGVGSLKADWHLESKIIDINAKGFAAIANWAFKYFIDQGGGQIAGTSSIAALKGMRQAITYNATKAFISTYMEGLHHRSINKKLNITVTDIRPGFVKTPLTERNKGMVWVADSDKAAKQIFKGIENKARILYVTKRWRLIAWLIRLVPDWLIYRFI